MPKGQEASAHTVAEGVGKKIQGGDGLFDFLWVSIFELIFRVRIKGPCDPLLLSIRSNSIEKGQTQDPQVIGPSDGTEHIRDDVQGPKGIKDPAGQQDQRNLEPSFRLFEFIHPIIMNE
jgi:hypothetical protein